MTLSTNRKVLLTVLGLAGAAFAADRVFFGGGMTGPATSMAADATEQAQALLIRPTGASTPAPKAEPNGQGVPLAKRLEQVRGAVAQAASEKSAAATSEADPFVAPPALQPRETPAPSAAANAKADGAVEFRVSAWVPDQSAMLVFPAKNGVKEYREFLKVGEVGRCGVKLVAAGRDSVTMERDGQRLEIRLTAPETGKTQVSIRSGGVK